MCLDKHQDGQAAEVELLPAGRGAVAAVRQLENLHCSVLVCRGLLAFSWSSGGRKAMPEDKEAGAGLFGWRDWKWSDNWHQVSRDRTEISVTFGTLLFLYLALYKIYIGNCTVLVQPTAGSYDWNETDQGHPGKPGFLNGGNGAIDFEDAYNPVRNPQRSIAWHLMQK